MQNVLILVFMILVHGENMRQEETIDKVKLEVYFRGFCPACQWFIKEPLQKLIKDPHYSKIIDLVLVPAAGMELDTKGELDCEGGPMECVGHRLFACAIEVDKDDRSKYISLIACLDDGTGMWNDNMLKCADTEKQAQVRKCYDNQSVDLLKEYMKLEKQAQVDWMPFIIVNGEKLGSADQGVGLSDVKEKLCEHYKGDVKFLPEDCPQPPEKGAMKPEAVDNSNQKRTNDKVLLQVYWRAYCPACAWFLTDPLPQLLGNSEFRDIVEFEPLPAAGTGIDASGKVVCTAGPVECEGHKYLGCAIDVFTDLAEQVEALSCLEDSKKAPRTDWKRKIAVCFTGEKRDKMVECFEKRGDSILLRNAKQVAKVEVGWMPYILVNGKVLGTRSTGVPYTHLKTEVCDAYKGNKIPSACKGDGKKKKEDGEPMIKPCQNKKKGAVYDDPPDVGALSRKRILEGKTFPENLQNSLVNGSDVSSPGYLKWMVIICFLVVGVLYQISLKNKKGSKYK